MSKPKKYQRRWLPPDLRALRSLAKRKLSARQAAPLLGRTVGAVKWKAMDEGVRFHAIEQPVGAQRTLKQRRLLRRVQLARWARARRGRSRR
jgi:hypothetical protein